MPVIAAGGGFPTTRFRFLASSPGGWGNDIKVEVRYRLRGRLGTPEVDLVVRAPDEPTETFRAIAPAALTETVNPRPDEVDSGSALVRLVARTRLHPRCLRARARAPRLQLGTEERDANGASPSTGRGRSAAARRLPRRPPALLDEPEVALLALPICTATSPHLPMLPTSTSSVTWTMNAIDPLHDRLLLLDVPAGVTRWPTPWRAVAWLDGLRNRNPGLALRNVAVYHPPLRVPDPLGGPAFPLKLVPASGHVAGVVSRLDRERGAALDARQRRVLRRRGRRRGVAARRARSALPRGRQPAALHPRQGAAAVGRLDRHRPRAGRGHVRTSTWPTAGSSIGWCARSA